MYERDNVAEEDNYLLYAILYTLYKHWQFFPLTNHYHIISSIQHSVLRFLLKLKWPSNLLLLSTDSSSEVEKIVLFSSSRRRYQERDDLVEEPWGIGVDGLGL